MIRSDNWKRYYDEEYSSYYLYNDITGESVWESDFAAAAKEASGETETSRLHNRSGDVDVDSGGEQRKSRTFRSKDFPREVRLSPEEQIQYDLRCYSRFLFVNATLVEAPLLIFEISLRLLLLCIYIAGKVAYYSCFRNWAKCVKVLKKYGREVLLNLATIPTIAIPGVLCWIYWGHSPEYDWDLRPLPTVLGYVDMRRFAVISYGGGALARNITNNADPPSEIVSKGDTTDTIVATLHLASSRGKSRARKLRKKQGAMRIKENNQDSWKGKLVWVPREIVADCSAFLGGDSDRLDSLEIVL